MILPCRLDIRNLAEIWTTTRTLLARPGSVPVIDASGLTAVDSAGQAYLLHLRRLGPDKVILSGLPPELDAALNALPVPPSAGPDSGPNAGRSRLSLTLELGRAAVELGQDIREIVSFVGELGCALGRSVLHPGRIRWTDTIRICEAVGVNAFFIVTLIGFLMGLIMSFQSAMPLRQFGAEIYVANFLGLSLLRELGPLVTAILLAGRSGSSFAAELGTMKVNEEINALFVMGLDPIAFLAVPRVLAAMFMTPLLVAFFNLAGLIGGAAVMLSLGYPPLTYMRQVVASVSLGDFAGGMFKTVVFSLLVAGIGCLRGLRAGTGARAVGEATTSAVVSGIILIAVTDGIFAVTFYALGI